MLNKAGFKINQEFEDKPHGDRERYRVSRIWLNQTLSQQRPRIRHYRANCRYNMCRRYIWYRTARAGSHPHSTRTMVGSVRDPGFPWTADDQACSGPKKGRSQSSAMEAKPSLPSPWTTSAIPCARKALLPCVQPLRESSACRAPLSKPEQSSSSRRPC